MAYFWCGYKLKNFLFEGLDIKSEEGFAGIFVALVSVSVLCEGIRTLRDFLLRRYADARHVTLSSVPSSNSNSSSSVRYKPQGLIDVSDSEALHDFSRGPMSSTSIFRSGSGEPELEAGEGEEEDSKFVTPSTTYRQTTVPEECNRSNLKQWLDLSLSTLLHMTYVFLGYTLMLAVMTWNVWILVAVALGIGMGYLVFGSLRYKKDKVLHRMTVTKGDCCDALIARSPINSHQSDHGDGEASTLSENCLGLAPDSTNNCNGEAVKECGAGDAKILHHRVTVGAQVHAA